MSKNKILFVALFVVFSGTAVANEKLTSITQVNTDIGYEDGVFSPSGTLPINWNNSLSSSVSYTGKQITDIGVHQGFEDSLNASTTKERRLGLNLLTYEFNPASNPNNTLSLGISYEHVRIEAEEDGFIALSGDTYRTRLLRDISVDRANIPVSYQLRTANFVNRLNADLTVYSSLALDQNLYFPIFNPNQLSLSDSQKQSTAYQVSWEGVYTKFANWAAPGWLIGYESTPYKYNSLMINPNIVGNVETTEIKSTTDTLTLEGRIYFGLNYQEKAATYIGVRRELITATMEESGNKSEGKLYKTSLVVGVDGRF